METVWELLGKQNCIIKFTIKSVKAICIGQVINGHCEGFIYSIRINEFFNFNLETVFLKVHFVKSFRIFLNTIVLLCLPDIELFSFR